MDRTHRRGTDSGVVCDGNSTLIVVFLHEVAKFRHICVICIFQHVIHQFFYERRNFVTFCSRRRWGAPFSYVIAQLNTVSRLIIQFFWFSD